MFNKVLLLAPIVIGFLFPSFILAEEEKDYIEVTEIQPEQWDVINGSFYDYNICLKDETIATVEATNDARIAADQILDACSKILIDLQDYMASQNIHPGYTQQYIYAMKNRMGRKMLGNVMVMMAQKEQRMKQAGKSESASPE